MTTSQIVQLEGDLGLRDAPNLAERLLSALNAGGDVAINANALASADLTILQLLVSAHKSAAERGVTLALSGGEGALRAALLSCGFIDASGAALTPQSAFLSGIQFPETAIGQ